ncbi:BRO1 domain-containing protein [Citrus sinensis]|uniref:BRO1 domain-containing protein n=1 Tax=Citrus sinensis TaxID=2711 RepID=A0ACB8M6M4_CITSI|nr:BRO1 domain-containing protein [Citrus sinensis]
MGCFLSTSKDTGGNRRRPGNIGEVSVYVPGLRIPKPVDFSQSLGDNLSKNMVERLSALRTRIVVMAAQEGPTITRTRRKSATQHGGSTLADLHQALEDYLPVLLGLVKDGSQLQYKVQFVWVNQEDEAEETAISNAWYEVLSVLHLMAMLSLSQANLLLLPRTSADGYQPKVSEESRRASVDIFLKAAGYLDCAVRHVLPQMSPELRRELPVDLAEGDLRALCLQALGQGVDIQLGMAIDSTKATLAVKRRLACEMVKYWQQAQDNIMNLPLANGWGEKHKLFVKWKYFEAKAAAYYYHGLILDEGNTEKFHGMAVAALQAADEYFKESKKACEAFNAAPPLSRCFQSPRLISVLISHCYNSNLIVEFYFKKVVGEWQSPNLFFNSLSPPKFELGCPLEHTHTDTIISFLVLDRNPPLWGTMKYLSEKIPKDTSSKVRINRDLYSYEKIMETAPTLPDFALALKPDEFQLPPVHPSWTDENMNRGQAGANQPKGDRG